MKYSQLLEQTAAQITEIMPWDYEAFLADNPDTLIVDVREANEFETVHIPGSIHAPRGVLESCCEWDFNETIPELVQARERAVLVVCRSGHRSTFAALTMQQLGFKKPVSLKLGLKGWNDDEMPLVNLAGDSVDDDFAYEFFNQALANEQRSPT